MVKLGVSKKYKNLIAMSSDFTLTGVSWLTRSQWTLNALLCQSFEKFEEEWQPIWSVSIWIQKTFIKPELSVQEMSA